MTKIFKLLPPECTPGLNLKQRDSLIEHSLHALPGGDLEKTIAMYEMAYQGVPNYLQYVYYPTNGQEGFIAFELRKFVRNDGSILIVYSKYRGTYDKFSQQSLMIFDYKNNELILNKEHLLPGKMDIKFFVKPNTPATAIAKINDSVSLSYNLDFYDTTIYFGIYPSSSLGQEDSFIIGYNISFIWNGKVFIRKLLPDKTVKYVYKH